MILYDMEHLIEEYINPIDKQIQLQRIISTQ